MAGRTENPLSNRNRLSLDFRELLFALDELVRTKPDDHVLLEIRQEKLRTEVQADKLSAFTLTADVTVLVYPPARFPGPGSVAREASLGAPVRTLDGAIVAQREGRLLPFP